MDREAIINKLYEAIWTMPGIKVVGPDQPIEKRWAEVKKAIAMLEEK